MPISTKIIIENDNIFCMTVPPRVYPIESTACLKINLASKKMNGLLLKFYAKKLGLTSIDPKFWLGDLTS